ncbi:MAG: bifunctional hydroxymethylpyrimidine kinase/phosphomethylpyrimidine kinase [Acidobacteria bacterium]|nr:bifunctional hydroxymethylpyrimidine kinase/phosphomethylpyrimidine kinase [Acidobacteriota bacterium]
MKIALTIAGYDPSSGAGITSDLMVFASYGLYGTSAITSLTVQSTVGVESSHPVAAETVQQTLKCLHFDLPPSGIKIGMLATAGIVEVVAEYLKAVRKAAPHTPIVLDPVLRSSSGRELLSDEGLEQMRKVLLPQVDWVTPNLSELSLLAGTAVVRRDQVAPAARLLQSGYPNLAILATGGHLEHPDDLLLCPGTAPVWIAGERVESTSTHGTGCALSSALLSRLLLGDEARAAAIAAKRYASEAIRRAVPLGHGHGPLNHLWPIRK